MDSQHVLYNRNHQPNDEMLTPIYAIEPLLEFLPRSGYKKDGSWPIIWCPFDFENSNYVKVLNGAGYKVICSHKATGGDFMTSEPDEWDIIVSNPPFTKKRETFERALSFGKPFALLMSLTWLNDSAPKQIFAEKELQLLMFDKRIHFANSRGITEKKTTFSSAYFCHQLLDKQIIMRKLNVSQQFKKKK